MAGPATLEQLHTSHDYDISQEHYGRSLRTIRAAGQVAQRREVGIEFVHSSEELAFDDFMTSLTEMLGTDEEFGEKANIENVRRHPVVGGKARSKTGEAMVDVLQNGVESSRKAVKKEPALEGQVERDEHDVETARIVDGLKTGTALWGVSMAPKKELKKYPKTFKRLGYQNDLAYFQFYAKDENEVIAGSFSVIVKDVNLFRELLAEQGMVIPQDANDNEWLKYAKTGVMSAKNAEAFIKSLRDTMHERSGSRKKRQSINEYTTGQKPKVRQLFKAYYTELSTATATGKNSQFLQDFAVTILGNDIQTLDPDMQQQLIRIANSRTFDDEAARTMNSVMLYAVAEELRKGLPEFFRQKNTGTYALPPALEQIIYHVQDQRIMHHLLAGNIRTGINAGREYGGCPGQIKLGNSSSSLDNAGDAETGSAGGGGPQEAYGGQGGESASELSDKKVMKCVNCPRCRTYHEELKPKNGKYTCKNKRCGYSVSA